LISYVNLKKIPFYLTKTTILYRFLEHTQLKAELAQKAITQLSPAYRTVFNLFVIEQLSHKEIAEQLGISEGTSKSNLAKAKMNLQRLLKEQFIQIEKR
jgi:RNA polymerase sigma factor (sigma-70 family)